ncbi:Hemolytic phospholipase C [Fusarium oxysporum f. sp. albedinis]|nr:Hemolytic phospholipase C [Fusarium oxysporum f. sp. albedinis]
MLHQIEASDPSPRTTSSPNSDHVVRSESSVSSPPVAVPQALQPLSRYSTGMDGHLVVGIPRFHFCLAFLSYFIQYQFNSPPSLRAVPHLEILLLLPFFILHPSLFDDTTEVSSTRSRLLL